MSLHLKNLAGSGLRHLVQSSDQHQKDVALQANRRDITWLPIEVPKPTRHREHPYAGAQWLVSPDLKLRQVGEDEFVSVLERERKNRSYYIRSVPYEYSETGRRDRKERRPAALQSDGATLAPWWSDRLDQMFNAGMGEAVIDFLHAQTEQLVELFAGQAKRRVLGCALHTDNGYHWHLVHSRVGDDNKLVKGSRQGVGLIGPDACAVLRLQGAGILPMLPASQATAANRLDIAQNRLYGRDPIDWQMAKLLDGACTRAFGAADIAGYQSNILGGLIEKLTLQKAAIETHLASLAGAPGAGIIMEFLPDQPRRVDWNAPFQHSMDIGL